MLTTLMTSAIRPTVFSVSISSRQPTRNMNSAMPTCPSTLSAGSDAAGKSSADTFGATHPSSDGPEQQPGDHLRDDGRLAQSSPRWAWPGARGRG